ncbi:DoxX family membrane protein [Fodinibius roseus]|uniref:DoxX family membrane protein n=1 Tax=Fodinibius roseus TaxID=1194090 RepID=UPI001B8D3806
MGLWGEHSAGWNSFLAYTADVNSYAPPEIVPFLAIAATVLEITFSVLLITGYKTRLAAYGASVLTLLFACI